MDKILEHHFRIDIAERVGVNAAIIYNSIVWWCSTNKDAGKHYYDEHWWMYHPRSAWVKSFPYLSDKNIQTAIEKLIEAGLIIKGNYNTDKFDRTNWYALADESPLTISGQSTTPKCLEDSVSPLTTSGQSIDHQRSINIVNDNIVNESLVKNKKNSACAHTREGVVADIIENNRAWVENQIKAGIEPDDIPALLDFAYDHYINTKGEEPGRQQLMNEAFYQLRYFKEHMRRERLRAMPYDERKNELWQQLRQLMPKYGKDLVTRFYAYQIKLKDGLMNAEQSPDFDPDAALTQWKLNDEQRQRTAL